MNKKWDRLVAFLNGVAGATELLNRAGKNGFFIEAVCLSATIIDAQLRIGIILKNQIETKSREIPIEYLFQEEKGKKYSERDIFKIAKEKQVINEDLFQKLSAIYDDRNRVIHRYIITEITTAEVLDIGIRYEKLLQEINNRIFEIEKERITLGIGMTVGGPNFKGPEAEEWLKDMAEEKHSSHWLSKAIKRDHK
jgi:hypothetical protein